MNGKKAKALRKQVYGDRTFRARTYHTDKNRVIHADVYRKMYQGMKRTF